MSTKAASSSKRFYRALASGFFALSFTVFCQLSRGQPVSAVEELKNGQFFLERLKLLGEREPSEVENRLLLDILNDYASSGGRTAVVDLEEYLKTFPDSAWSVSLHANLAAHYESRGRVTAAMEHWEATWAATAQATDGPAKELADRALVRWARQLLALNRMKELEAVLTAQAGRSFGPGPDYQVWLQIQEAYARAEKDPEGMAQCGLFVLEQMALAVNGQVPGRSELWNTPTPMDGLTLEELAELGTRQGLKLTAVFREAGDALPVPSIVHLQLGHYAAIVTQTEDRFLVRDPAAETQRELTADDINAEASGFFLVTEMELPKGWRVASREESTAVKGTVLPPPQSMRHDTPPCEECQCPPGRSSGGAGRGGSAPGGNPQAPAPDAGVPQPQCAGCGMPSWLVSEPYLNLWVVDMPYWYQPSKGPRVELRLYWRQWNDSPVGAGDTRFGDGWACNWQSKVVDSEKTLYLPGGARLQYAFGTDPNLSLPHYRDYSRLEHLASGGYAVHFRDGRQWRYEQQVGTTGHYWLTEQRDAQGLKLTFAYSGATAKLLTVTDADGVVTTLYYDYGNQYVTRVSRPYVGYQVTFVQSGGYLSSLTDSVGIVTSFSYNTSTHWVNSITTPYGQTAFEISSVVGVYDRAIRITHPGSLGQEVYMAIDGVASSIPALFDASQIPVATPFATPSYPYGTMDANHRNSANTFYWDSEQYSALGQPDLSQFAWSEFRRGRIRHWLKGPPLWSPPAPDTLGHEQAPSPDGTANGTLQGVVTWYDYTGKQYSSPDYCGDEVLPAVVARRQPDGTTWWAWTQRNDLGLPTRLVEKWTKEATDLFRTNHFYYAANNIDLERHTFGPAGAEKLIEALVYDSANHPHLPVRATNALFETTYYGYDGQHRIQTVRTPAGLLSTSTYGPDGYLSQVVDSEVGGNPVRTNSYIWFNGQVSVHEDPRGLLRSFTWDGLGRLKTIEYPANPATGLPASTNRFFYTNTAGVMLLDLTKTVDRLGKTTAYEYDGRRRLRQATDPLGRVTFYDYCGCGSPSSVTRAQGTPVQETTYYDYDNAGRRVSMTEPDGSMTVLDYDSLGRLAFASTALGSVAYGYDNLDRREWVANSVGLAEATVYDLEDRPTSVTDANGVTVTLTYDALGRLRTRTYPDTGVEKFGYTANKPWVTSYTNQLGESVHYTYRVTGWKSTEVHRKANGTPTHTITFVYSAAGDLKSLTDPKNQQTQWGYDEYGQVTNKLDQLGVEILRYGYDANSRLISRWSKAKGTTAYGYDDVGNLTTVNYPSSQDLTYQYNALNRVTSMVDAAGTTAYTYRPGGQLWTENGPWTDDTVTYGYHPTVGRLRTGLSLQQPGGSTWTQNYSYDAAERLQTVGSPVGTFTYTYKGAGNLWTNLALPNAAAITNSLDNVGRLTGTYLKANTTVVLNNYLYQYDLAGQRWLVTRFDGSRVTNTYDNLGQLTRALGSGVGQSTEDLGYGYDLAWNLSKRTNVASVTTFGVNAKNELTTVGSTSYVYDNNGNLTTETGTRVFTYDDENQLASVNYAAGSWKHEFKYDGRGRLRRRIDYGWNGSSYYVTGETRYVYDGMRVIQERNSSNLPTVSYTRGNDLSGSREGAGGIGGLLARSDVYSSGSMTRHACYFADGNGNVVNLVDAASAHTVWATYRYSPFGATTYSSGTLASANVYRFSSKEYLANPGLYYYGYRFYDPNLQRWLNRDPIGEAGGINLCGYVENDPVNNADTDGLSVIGKVIPRVIKVVRGRRAVKATSVDDAVRLYKEGEAFVMCPTKDAAKEAARKAGKGSPPIHEIDKKTGRPHYHPNDRSGHFLYGLAGALTFSHYAVQGNPYSETAGGWLDLINPLSIGQDILDIRDAIFK